jgi:ABC-type phosphate/phosphonate transport system substrate-binding protein
VRKDISPVLKLRIKGLLLNLEETEEGRQVLSRFGAKRFIVTTNEEYNTVHQMVDKLKIDLQNFPY